MYCNYEVIRFIKQDSKFFMINDYVPGEMLGTYVDEHPDVEKKKLFSWVMEILDQLEKIAKGKGPISITPFSIIRKMDDTVALLDVKARVNQKFLTCVEKPSGKPIYSFGKTLQFLLARSNITPALTKGEKRKLQKIISKCLTANPKKTYQSYADIAKDFPKIKQNKPRGMGKKFMVFVMFLMAVCMLWMGRRAALREQKSNGQFMEFGLSYFAAGDYEEAIFMFRQVTDKALLMDYDKMASFLYESLEGEEEAMEGYIRRLMEGEENLSTEEKCSIIRVCSKLDSTYAREILIRLGESIKPLLFWGELREVGEMLAVAYEKEGNYIVAFEIYEKMVESPFGEEIYKAMIALLERDGNAQEALIMCQDGMFHNEKCVSLELYYLSMICQDDHRGKEEKEAEIQKVVENHVELKNEKRFLSLQKQYGICVEGDRIWLEE